MERYGGGHLGRSCNKGGLKYCRNVTLPNNIMATIDFEFRVKLSWFSGNIQKTKRVQPPRLLQVNLHLLQKNLDLKSVYQPANLSFGKKHTQQFIHEGWNFFLDESENNSGISWTTFPASPTPTL